MLQTRLPLFRGTWETSTLAEGFIHSCFTARTRPVASAWPCSAQEFQVFANRTVACVQQKSREGSAACVNVLMPRVSERLCTWLLPVLLPLASLPLRLLLLTLPALRERTRTHAHKWAPPRRMTSQHQRFSHLRPSTSRKRILVLSLPSSLGPSRGSTRTSSLL